jgi:hypothetical protein
VNKNKNLIKIILPILFLISLFILFHLTSYAFDIPQLPQCPLRCPCGVPPCEQEKCGVKGCPEPPTCVLDVPGCDHPDETYSVGNIFYQDGLQYFLEKPEVILFKHAFYQHMDNLLNLLKISRVYSDRSFPKNLA